MHSRCDKDLLLRLWISQAEGVDVSAVGALSQNLAGQPVRILGRQRFNVLLHICIAVLFVAAADDVGCGSRNRL